MAEVIIYTSKHCGFCESAKKFFDQKKVPYKTVDLTKNDSLRMELSEKHNWRTVPMIFIGGEFVGGFSDLVELSSKGLLDEKLGK